MIAIDADYRIMIFNRAAEQALGYAAAEVIGRRAIPIFMDPRELEARARSLSEELGEHIPVGPEIFTRIPLRDGFEKREWTFIRKDGSRFPVNVIITPLRDDGHRGGRIPRRHRGRDAGAGNGTHEERIHRGRQPRTALAAHFHPRLARTDPRRLGGQPAAEGARLLEIAQSNCERLVLLVNDILDIEKFSAGQMRFDMQTVSLASRAAGGRSQRGLCAQVQRAHRARAPSRPRGTWPSIRTGSSR